MDYTEKDIQRSVFGLHNALMAMHDTTNVPPKELDQVFCSHEKTHEEIREKQGYFKMGLFSVNICDKCKKEV